MSIRPLILKNGIITPTRTSADIEELKTSMGIGTSNFVDVSSNQTISGVKTFSGSLVVPNSSGAIVGTIWRSGDALQYRDGANTTKTLLNSAGNLSNLADKQVSLNNLVNGQVANRVLRSNGTNVTLSQVALDTDVINVLPISSGGTGSSTQNFVDLTTSQNIGNIKIFNEIRTFGSNNAFRMINSANTAAMFYRSDNSNMFLLLTNIGDPGGTFNSLRPFSIVFSTGALTLGTQVLMTGLPTSSTGLAVGSLWRNGNVINIV